MDEMEVTASTSGSSSSTVAIGLVVTACLLVVVLGIAVLVHLIRRQQNTYPPPPPSVVRLTPLPHTSRPCGIPSMTLPLSCSPLDFTFRRPSDPHHNQGALST
jgi:hypothetical protein